jgi:C1A family cysteine protease
MASNFGTKPLVTTAKILLTVVMMVDAILYAVEARDLASAGGYTEEAMKARHEKWMVEHGRTYKDEFEKARRFEIFKTNVDFIERSNAAGDKKYTLGINKFADITRDEFKAVYTGFKPMPAGTKKLLGFKYENFTVSDDNQEVDWRKEGAVTGIKNQGKCGTYITYFFTLRNSQFDPL